jgi:hypothetical protein
MTSLAAVNPTYLKAGAEELLPVVSTIYRYRDFDPVCTACQLGHLLMLPIMLLPTLRQALRSSCQSFVHIHPGTSTQYDMMQHCSSQQQCINGNSWVDDTLPPPGCHSDPQD